MNSSSWAVDSSEAAAIAQLLPSKKTGAFAPVLAERAAFASTLLQVTPNAQVTPALIGANVLMFVVATSLGGGLHISNPAVMIRLGTDYTPLTGVVSGGAYSRQRFCILVSST
jgi:hypothetical protein